MRKPAAPAIERTPEMQGPPATMAPQERRMILSYTLELRLRLPNHRIPVAGLLPYFPLDKITDNYLAVLPSMNGIVEGSALRPADAADNGTMGEAATRLGQIASGCVASHQVFRGRPGASPPVFPESKARP